MKQPKVEFRKNVVNQSDRTDAIKLLVIHTAEYPNKEGIDDLKWIADFFDQTSTQASSTIATDGQGNTVRLMSDSAKPWTQASYNSQSLSVENIGYASTTKEEWFKKYHAQLAENARWIAYWSVKHDIPIRRAWTRLGGVQRTGVATHKQLGSHGGGHGDPGSGYPIRYVMKLARYYKLKEKAPRSKSFQKAKRQTNKIRKHYGLELVD